MPDKEKTDYYTTAEFCDLINHDRFRIHTLANSPVEKKLGFPTPVKLRSRYFVWKKEDVHRYIENKRKRKDLINDSEALIKPLEAAKMMDLTYPELIYYIKMVEDFPALITIERKRFIVKQDLLAYMERHGIKPIVGKEKVDKRVADPLKDKRGSGKLLHVFKGIHNAHKKEKEKSLIVDLIERSMESLNRFNRRMRAIDVENGTGTN